jgi:hypothetical protein
MILFSYLTDFSYFPLKIVFQKLLDTVRTGQKWPFWKGVYMVSVIFHWFQLLWIHLISLVPIFVDWGKKAFLGIVKFVDCRLQKIKKKGFEILKFMDFHFKFVDFVLSRFYGKVFILSKFTSTPIKYGSLLYIISLLQFW